MNLFVLWYTQANQNPSGQSTREDVQVQATWRPALSAYSFRTRWGLCCISSVKQLPWCSSAAITKYRSLGGLDSRNVFSHGSKGWKSNIRVPVCLDSGGEHLLLACRQPPSCCALTGQGGGELSGVSSYKSSHPIPKVSSHNLITSEHHHSGIRASLCKFWGRSSVHSIPIWLMDSFFQPQKIALFHVLLDLPQKSSLFLLLLSSCISDLPFGITSFFPEVCYLKMFFSEGLLMETLIIFIWNYLYFTLGLVVEWLTVFFTSIPQL